jgi:hypothetical protein
LGSIVEKERELTKTTKKIGGEVHGGGGDGGSRAIVQVCEGVKHGPVGGHGLLLAHLSLHHPQVTLTIVKR